MKITLSPLLKEVLWLALSMLLTALLAFLLFGNTFMSGTIDIHWADTYLVIAHLHILLPMFLIVTCIVFFIKESRHKFSRAISNWILLLAGLSLIITLSFLVKTFAAIFASFANDHTIGGTETDGLRPSPISPVINNSLVVIQVIITIMLLYVTFHWGKNRKTVGPKGSELLIPDL